MAKKPVLVIMAAGMGSRYGGLKQIDKMTATGEIILDFSLYDAMMAGFDKAVFVIREEHRDFFRELVDERAGRYMEIEYAYQSLDDIPEGYEVPEGREKPWGTSHAILACRDVVDGPFAVINADDFYGADGFVTIYDFLSSIGEQSNTKGKVNDNSGQPYQFCLMGYELENTITENGHVARGVCEVDEEGYLKEITERTKIQRRAEGICYTEDEGETWHPLQDKTPVSMNFWGFTYDMIEELKKEIEEFFATEVSQNPQKSEFLLPKSVDKLIKSGKAKVKVLPCKDRWCGVTYKEDKQSVMDTLESKKDKGEYPDKLWK
ncbi:MAG: sugar phosphate nucleotidyltransferase [Bacillota bacterium]|nr:sugar phosphate nucleotidyltransferase [Bacillota bacterium]